MGWSGVLRMGFGGFEAQICLWGGPLVLHADDLRDQGQVSATKCKNQPMILLWKVQSDPDGV